MTFFWQSAICALILGSQIALSAPRETTKVILARANTRYTHGKHFGKPVFIRIFKEDYILELWVQDKDGDWNIIETYDIAGMSGHLGPKKKKGDKQAPEGFYRVTRGAMNPYSSYHLAFNIGYPNKYDRSLGRTGGHIMIHGSNVSLGCFAMTNGKVEEIYTLVNEAFKAGVKSVPVQIYPFEMTNARMKEERNSPHYKFWQHILPGYAYTEKYQAPYPDRDSQ